MREFENLVGPAAVNESQIFGIKNKDIVVSVISIKEIDFYQKAGKKSGFEIEVVGQEGDYYVTGQAVNVLEAAKKDSVEEFRRVLIIRPVISKLPIGEGFVAVSVQKPISKADHTSFYQALNSFKQ